MNSLSKKDGPAGETSSALIEKNTLHTLRMNRVSLERGLLYRAL